MAGVDDSATPRRRLDDAPVAEVGMTVKEMVTDHDKRIRSLEDWRLEMRTLNKLAVAILGTSVVGAAAGVLALLNGIVALGR